jgi:hypothetical protein
MRPRELIVAFALLFGCSRQAAPPVEGAPAPSISVTVNAKAPDALLTRSTGTKIALADVLHTHAQTVVVFYRGLW